MPEVAVTASLNVEIEVFCEACGAGLCNQSEGFLTRTRRQPAIRVTPCEKCLEEARQEVRHQLENADA